MLQNPVVRFDAPSLFFLKRGIHPQDLPYEGRKFFGKRALKGPGFARPLSLGQGSAPNCPLHPILCRITHHKTVVLTAGDDNLFLSSF